MGCCGRRFFWWEGLACSRYGRTCWYLGWWGRVVCQGPVEAASTSPAQSRCGNGEALGRAAENLVLLEQALHLKGS